MPLRSSASDETTLSARPSRTVYVVRRSCDSRLSPPLVAIHTTPEREASAALTERVAGSCPILYVRHELPRQRRSPDRKVPIHSVPSRATAIDVTTSDDSGAAVTPDQAATETPGAEPTADPEAPAATEPVAEQVIPALEPTAAAEMPGAEPAPALDQTETEASAQGTSAPAETSVAQPKKPRKAKAVAAPKEKKLSALDAAAKVLAEAGQAMTCKEMIAAMAEKNYWASPGGKTPDATLYSAILREIGTKGADARFVKSERGKFARKA